MDLSEWRSRIDEIDRTIVQLLNERAESVLEIGARKRGDHAPVYQPAREERVRDNLHGANAGPLPNAALDRVFDAIMAEMRKLQAHNVVQPTNRP